MESITRSSWKGVAICLLFALFCLAVSLVFSVLVSFAIIVVGCPSCCPCDLWSHHCVYVSFVNFLELFVIACAAVYRFSSAVTFVFDDVLLSCWLARIDLL